MEHSEDSDSGSESPRPRSRSPAGRNGGYSSDEHLTPDSKKTMALLEKVVKRQLAPVKRDLTKNMNTTGQIKATCDQLKRGLADVKVAQSSMDEQMRKARKANPKANMSSHVVSKMYVSVFENLKKGKKVSDLKTAVFEELLDNGTIKAEDEDGIKEVAGEEFSHLKSHLRGQISKDLALANTAEFPKTEKYLKTHLKVDILPEDTKEFLNVMAFGLLKFENCKDVVLNERDKNNKKKVADHVENFWSWVKIKFELFTERGESHGEKMQNFFVTFGYQKRERDGAVRRPSDS